LGLRNAFNNNTGLPNNQITRHPNYARALAVWRNARRRINNDVGGHRARMLTTQRRLTRTFGPGNLQAQITQWRQKKPIIQEVVRQLYFYNPRLTNKEVGFFLRNFV
jgi:hypothetical protein